MLVLSRKAGESIRIGNDIRVSVVALQGNRVRIAIDAPEDVLILRGELATLKADLESSLSPFAAAGAVSPR